MSAGRPARGAHRRAQHRADQEGGQWGVSIQNSRISHYISYLIITHLKSDVKELHMKSVMADSRRQSVYPSTGDVMVNVNIMTSHRH